MVAKLIKRYIRGYKYHTCSKCGETDTIESPIDVKILQCCECDAILDGNFNNYCDKCGEPTHSYSMSQPLYKEDINE